MVEKLLKTLIAILALIALMVVASITSAARPSGANTLPTPAPISVPK